MVSQVSIVIIDDNEGSPELLSDALADEDVRIFTASDPEEGIDIVYREIPNRSDRSCDARRERLGGSRQDR
jgi:CheY-like chemotaxis protein